MDLPIFNIQPDFVDCINDVSQGKLASEQFYINFEPDVNTIKEHIVKVTKLGDTVIFESEKGSRFWEESFNTYRFTINEGGYSCRFRLPIKDHTSLFSQCLSDRQTGPDISAVGIVNHPVKRVALGDVNGDIRVFKNFGLDQHIKAHEGDITSLKFFPSGEVLLSTSIDMQLKIWSAVDGSNPRTWLAHKRAITGSAIVERGRNILSSSLDGSIKLWDCGSSQMLHSFNRSGNADDPINAMQLLGCKRQVACLDDPSPLEFGTENKTVIAGHSSGVLSYYDLYTKDQITTFPSEFMSSCTELASHVDFNAMPSVYIYAGYENGSLAQWDLRRPDKSVNHIYLNKGTPIEHILHEGHSLFLSSNIDTNCQIPLGENGQLTTLPTFLVSDNNKIMQYAKASEDNSTWAVGTRSFCARY